MEFEIDREIRDWEMTMKYEIAIGSKVDRQLKLGKEEMTARRCLRTFKILQGLIKTNLV
jgi:hypothetical protein